MLITGHLNFRDKINSILIIAGVKIAVTPDKIKNSHDSVLLEDFFRSQLLQLFLRPRLTVDGSLADVQSLILNKKDLI